MDMDFVNYFKTCNTSNTDELSIKHSKIVKMEFIKGIFNFDFSGKRLLLHENNVTIFFKQDLRV